MSATFFLMVEALLQKVVRARRIVSLDLKSAQALSDPVRGKILEAIFHKPMTAEELAGALENSGKKKAVTTIRHHLDALKTAGLIEASKMVEVRGALMKYYAPTIRAFAFQTPPGLEENNARLIQGVSSKISGIMKTILADKKVQATHLKGGHICPFCRGNHFREFVAFEILGRAIALAMEGNEYAENISAEKENKNLAKA